MNAGLLILRVASERCDAQSERDGAGLRSAAATSSQLRRSSTIQPSTQVVVFVASLLEVLPAAPRGGTRRDLEGEREQRAASAPAQQHQLRRSNKQATAVSRDHERSTGRKTSLSNPSNIIAQPLKLFATFLPP